MECYYLVCRFYIILVKCVLQSGKFGKLNKPIRFPEILNLAPYMSGTSDKSPIYSLYGVVVHLDIMNAAFSGHYVCYVKNIQNKWFKVDDSMVCLPLSIYLHTGSSLFPKIIFLNYQHMVFLVTNRPRVFHLCVYTSPRKLSGLYQ